MNDPLTVGSLFSGIGGFDLGFERAGMSTAWFCEQDDYCRRVLNRHWPDVPVYPDVTQLRGSEVERVDVLAGGFPCQDLSLAGKGAGITGSRSGLWSEYARLIGELQPRYVVVENVTALLGRGFGTVLGDLAALGYDAEWDCIPASAVGAPHRRDRIWIVAYPSGDGLEGHGRTFGAGPEVTNAGGDGRSESVANADRLVGSPAVAVGGSGGEVFGPEAVKRTVGCGGSIGDSWPVEPDVGRVAHGVPARVDRLKCLGNALVPQIAEWIGNRIMSYERGV